MNNKEKPVQFLARGAVIAALYIVLTLVFSPISFGPGQIRVAEVLTILPLFTPAAVPGLFVGCLLGNLLAGAIIWDVIFGSIATLIGAVFSYALRFNRWLVPIPAILANAIIIPFVLKYGYGFDLPLIVMGLYVGAGEFISCFVFGEIFASALLRRQKHVQKEEK